MSLRYRWLVKEKGANCIVTNPEILKYMELREKSVEAWKDEGWIDCGANDDDVFYYCNGIESFKQLAEYGMGEFIVTFCWSFF